MLDYRLDSYSYLLTVDLLNANISPASASLEVVEVVVVVVVGGEGRGFFAAGAEGVASVGRVVEVVW